MDSKQLSIHYCLEKNRMYCKKVLWHKSYIHLRLTTIPMVWKSFLVNKLSIHLRLCH